MTLEDVVQLVNDHIGDSTEDRITNTQRFRKITEATNWIQEQLENDHQKKSVKFDFLDTVFKYPIKEQTAKLLDTSSLHRPLGEDNPQFTKRSANDMKRFLSDGSSQRGFAIDWTDASPALLINYSPTRKALIVGSMDSLTADGGTWATVGDAENLRVDSILFSQGVGSLVFDIDPNTGVAGLSNAGLTSRDLEDEKDIATWLVDISVPDVSDLDKVVLRWGSDSSNYWEEEVEKDMFQEDFVNGDRMTLAFEWDNSTETGSPDVKDVKYAEIRLVFTGSPDAQSTVRFDNLRLVVPKELELNYLSYIVGTNSAGEDITEFTALTDVPYYSGQYDQLKYPVAHWASSLIFSELRLYDDQQNHQVKADERLQKLTHLIPRSRQKEVKQFRPTGLNFSSRGFGKRF